MNHSIGGGCPSHPIRPPQQDGRFPLGSESHLPAGAPDSNSDRAGYRHGAGDPATWMVLVIHPDSGLEQTVWVLGCSPEIAAAEARQVTNATVVDIHRVEIQ